jgi:hypothetical protein
MPGPTLLIGLTATENTSATIGLKLESSIYRYGLDTPECLAPAIIPRAALDLPRYRLGISRSSCSFSLVLQHHNPHGLSGITTVQTPPWLRFYAPRPS